MRSTLSKLFTTAFVLACFGPASTTLAQEDSAAKSADAAGEAKIRNAEILCYGPDYRKTQKVDTSAYKKLDSKEYENALECYLDLAGIRSPNSDRKKSCDSIAEEQRKAESDYKQACGDAGINGNCDQMVEKCSTAMNSDQSSISGMLKSNDFTAQSFADSCRTSTSEDRQRQKEVEQERIDEQTRQAQDDIKEATDKMHESQQQVLEAQQKKVEVEAEARKQIRNLGVALPQKIQELNEESFATIIDYQRQIDNQQNKRAAAVLKLGVVENTKASQLLQLIQKCEESLDMKKAQMREALEKYKTATGGRNQVKTFNDISKLTESQRIILKKHYNKCMVVQNKMRALAVNSANNERLALQKEIDTYDNEMARLNEMITFEKESLINRINSAKATAENQRLDNIEMVNAAIATLNSTTELSAHQQQTYQNQITSAQQRLAQGSNSMMGQASGPLGAIMNLFASGGLDSLLGGGTSATPQGTNSATMSQVLAKKSIKESYDRQLADCKSDESNSSGGDSSSDRSTASTRSSTSEKGTAIKK